MKIYKLTRDTDILTFAYLENGTSDDKVTLLQTGSKEHKFIFRNKDVEYGREEYRRLRSIGYTILKDF